MIIKKKSVVIKYALVLLAVLCLNIVGSKLYYRFDLTKDQRYTLSEPAKDIINKATSPLIVDVFLEGDFPSEYRRLRNETQQLLEEFAIQNKQIKFNFINPIVDEESRDENISQLIDRGIEPLQLNVNAQGKSSQELIFPWALASYNNETVIIPLIKNKIGASQQDVILNSIQHLEYAFSDGFKKLLVPKTQKIAFLKGNGQWDDLNAEGRINGRYLEDFILTLREHYNIAPFTLDSVARNPQKTLDQLNSFDLIISAKPTQAFSETEKMVLDQYTMHGGKSIWLTESVIIDQDSLFNDTGSNVAIRRDLNLTDFFFSYGVRINPVIVNDIYSAPITLAIGEGSEAQFQPIRWPYSPLAAGDPKHPITSNVNLVRFDFASQIDTLKSSAKKTILLKSSKHTKLDGVPSEISLDIVTQDPDPSTYNKGPQALAVLLEGEFSSVYKNRIKPFQSKNHRESSIPTKMLIISDGDIIKNEVVRGNPQELGFDRWTGQTFGNMEFLLNSVDYFLDDNRLIDIRNKDISIAFLDSEKIKDSSVFWQFINIALPVVILGVFGIIFQYYRKRKYAYKA